MRHRDETAWTTTTTAPPPLWKPSGAAGSAARAMLIRSTSSPTPGRGGSARLPMTGARAQPRPHRRRVLTADQKELVELVIADIVPAVSTKRRPRAPRAHRLHRRLHRRPEPGLAVMNAIGDRGGAAPVSKFCSQLGIALAFWVSGHQHRDRCSKQSWPRRARRCPPRAGEANFRSSNGRGAGAETQNASAMPSVQGILPTGAAPPLSPRWRS